MNIDQMKQDLYKIRISEILKLIDAQLLAGLLRYYKDHQSGLETNERNIELYELKLALEIYHSE